MTARRETLAGVALGIAAIALAAALIFVGEAHASPPPPNAAPPLAYTVVQVERALVDFADQELDRESADAVTWRLDAAKCDRPRARRYRCSIGGRLLEAGEPVVAVTVRLTACKPRRGVYINGLSRTRARVVVKWTGPTAGGLACVARTHKERIA